MGMLGGTKDYMFFFWLIKFIESLYMEYYVEFCWRGKKFKNLVLEVYNLDGSWKSILNVSKVIFFFIDRGFVVFFWKIFIEFKVEIL